MIGALIAAAIALNIIGVVMASRRWESPSDYVDWPWLIEQEQLRREHLRRRVEAVDHSVDAQLRELHRQYLRQQRPARRRS